MFCTPAFGGMVTWKYFTSMMNLGLQLQAKGVDPLFYGIENQSLVPRARNDCVGYFLAHDAPTHLFFVDADVGFQAQDAFNVLTCGLDVVFGAYPKKDYFWDQAALQAALGNSKTGEEIRNSALDYVVRFEHGKDRLEGKQINGNLFVKCRDGGAGFLCIRRKVLLDMIAAYPERRYVCDTRHHEGEERWDLFPSGLTPSVADPSKNDYLGEDHGFVRLWKLMGGECWVSAGAQLSHTGTHTFFGQFGPKGK